MALTMLMLKGLSEEGEVGLKESFLQARVFRIAISDYLNHKIVSNRKKTRSEKYILEGDFALKMAWAMGYEKAQAEFVELMSSPSEK